MNINSKYFINHELLFGKLSMELLPKESAALNLLQCEGPQIEQFWQMLWEGNYSYDDLPFSCKEVMPSIINKVQRYLGENQNLSLLLPQHLKGLPKYSWTRNNYIINQLNVLVSALHEQNIEFIAIKGICEIIEGAENAIFRTTRDIDLLIHDYDFFKFKEIIERFGWRVPERQKRFKYFTSPLISPAETFYSPDYSYSMDVHFRLFHDKKEIGERFTERVWKYKKASKKFNNIFVPSLEHRLIIAFENASELSNCLNGLFFKYVVDFNLLLALMGEKELSNVQCEIKLIPSFESNFNSTLKMLKNKKNEFEKIVEGKYLINTEINSKILLFVIYGQALFNNIRLMFKKYLVFHVLIYVWYKLFFMLFIRFPKFLFFSLFGDSKVANGNHKYIRHIILSLFLIRNHS